MLGAFFARHNDGTELLSSKLLNERTFYPALMKDLRKCHSELIIESPFVTYRRLDDLLSTLEKLKERRVRIVINTRDPRALDDDRRRLDTHEAVSKLQHMGLHVIFTHDHHRKLVIIDRCVLYEGSLNVLSQSNCSEAMRRTESTRLAWQMIRFIGIDKRY